MNAETQNFVSAHRNDDIRTLALSMHKYPNVDAQRALENIAGRQMAKHKIPTWYERDDIWYPSHQSMEQCSSELAAEYKTALCFGKTMVDVTGGFGVDCAWMSQRFAEVTYVERQPALCQTAEHNFKALGLNHIRVVNANCVDYLNAMERVDCLFIDPGRRLQQGERVVALEDCEPNVVMLENLLLEKSRRVIIKLSPMLDIAHTIAQLQRVVAVHVVAVRNECKELLLVLDNEEHGNMPLHCINFVADECQQFIFSREEEADTPVAYARELKKYLYEPNAAILKGGAYRSVAMRFELEKLHADSHLYTSDSLMRSFPGRVFEVEGCSNEESTRKLLEGVEKANLTIRNYPGSVEKLRKSLAIKEGGEVYLFATTMANKEKVIIKGRKIS